YRALRPGRFLLVVPPGTDGSAIAAWRDRVDLATAGGATRTTVLVRPDGYIAWAADGPDGRSAVRAALRQWCGPAAGRVAH
ncbi:aromatic-ring hydroxylase C-terminal domain-containing protein, partial [Actinoallomurus acaciae]